MDNRLCRVTVKVSGSNLFCSIVIPNEYEGCKKTEKDVQLHIESGGTPRNISVKPQGMKRFLNSEGSRIVECLKPALKKCLLLEQEGEKIQDGGMGKQINTFLKKQGMDIITKLY